VQLARIYEVLALVCPKCGGDMRITASIDEGPVIREILGHLGEPISAPHLAPASVGVAVSSFQVLVLHGRVGFSEVSDAILV